MGPHVYPPELYLNTYNHFLLKFPKKISEKIFILFTDHVKNDPPCQQNITMEHISFCSAKNIGNVCPIQW